MEMPQTHNIFFTGEAFKNFLLKYNQKTIDLFLEKYKIFVAEDDIIKSIGNFNITNFEQTIKKFINIDKHPNFYALNDSLMDYPTTYTYFSRVCRKYPDDVAIYIHTLSEYIQVRERLSRDDIFFI